MVYLYTSIALLFFATNSILCKMALGSGAIDAGSFTAIRLFSGALVLWIILQAREKPKAQKSTGSWISAFALFSYAAAFSFAYLTLSTGTGALILFGAVQITMLSVAIFSGERLSILEWIGILGAFGGLVYLVSPGIEAPSLVGSLLMGISGMAWGIYSLRGRQIADPLSETAANFRRALLPLAVLFIILAGHINASPAGVLLAAASGGIASGVGYSIWYAVTTKIKAISASVVQLVVPAIAALGGIVFLGESVSTRLLIAGAITLGGIALAITSKSGHSVQLDVASSSKLTD